MEHYEISKKPEKDIKIQHHVESNCRGEIHLQPGEAQEEIESDEFS